MTRTAVSPDELDSLDLADPRRHAALENSAIPHGMSTFPVALDPEAR
jgi:hypothetical protein